MAVDTKAQGATSATTPIEPLTIKRRDVGPHDVGLDVLYCGMCHSDLHTTRNDWRGTKYPSVPGHEIIGRVRSVGSQVTKFKVGETVAVGTFVDSCRECKYCRAGEETFCEKGIIQTFGSPDSHLGGHTFGGYSAYMVVDENYTLHVPDGLDLARAGPLLCAGCTVYTPLRHYETGPGKRVGIAGLGGLGHLAVKFAAAMGAHVTALTRSPSKAEEAHRLGAHDAIITTDEKQMKEAAKSFDLIIDCIPVQHSINEALSLMKLDGVYCIVGQLGLLDPIFTIPLLMQRVKITGSIVADIKVAQEMLNFCAEKNLHPDTELITPAQINEGYERMEKGDVRYRFVIDMSKL